MLLRQIERFEPGHGARQTFLPVCCLDDQPRACIDISQRLEDATPWNGALAGMPMPVGIAVRILQMDMAQKVIRRQNEIGSRAVP